MTLLVMVHTAGPWLLALALRLRPSLKILAWIPATGSAEGWPCLRPLSDQFLASALVLRLRLPEDPGSLPPALLKLGHIHGHHRIGSWHLPWCSGCAFLKILDPCRRLC
ncbi:MULTISPECIES: hypothetical protein [Bacillus subtilis group]|uniref:hypothetical protein n=1 Tax=Bacillus subtilis group TaxID=653685 RepID=UPI0011A427EC|nr:MULTISPECIES: hypothetical protein [Bacillus subtilis group]